MVFVVRMGEDNDKGTENKGTKGGGMIIDFKTEKEIEKKSYFISGLSLLELSLLHKENKEVSELETKGEGGRRQKAHHR